MPKLSDYLSAVVLMVLLIGPKFGFCADASTGRTLVINADNQFAYAEKRFARVDYTAAAEEYRRFLHFFPKDARAEKARFRVGETLFITQEFNKAIAEFKAIIDRYLKTDPAASETALKAYWMISTSSTRLGAPGAAVVNLQNLVKLTDDVNVADEAWYRIAWIYIETAQWERAAVSLGRISEGNRDRYRLKRISAGLANVGAIERKNPRLAGFLSIVPGLGQIYCQRHRDALIAFLVNGALIAVTYEAFDNGNEVLGGVVGFLGFGFYSGNIYNAANSARKFNRNRTARFIDKLKSDTKIDLAADWKKRGVALSIRMPF